MTSLIGGFSIQQYKNYLYLPSQASSSDENVNQWISHFNVMNIPIIAVLINRLAYFLLHRFSEYPNNTYLFEKFKTHDFASIENQDQVNAAKEIFECFKICVELNQQELIKLGESLHDVERRVAGKMTTPEEKLAKAGEEPKNEGDSADLSENKKEAGGDKPPQSEKKTAEQILQKNPADEIPVPLSKLPHSKEKGGIAPSEADHEIEARKESDKDEDIDKAVKSNKEQRKARRAEARKKREQEKAKKSAQPQKDVIKKALPDDGKAIFDEDLSDLYGSGLDAVVESKKAKDDPLHSDAKPLTDDIHPKNDALDQLQHLFAGVAVDASDEERIDDDGLYHGSDDSLESELPKEIAAIVEQPFPLSDAQSLNDLLSSTGGMNKKSRKYYKDFNILLAYAHTLEADGKKNIDARFADYLEKMNRAFCRALDAAKKDAASLHEELKKKFEDNLPEALENDEVICTAEQMGWLVEAISSRYPAIYQFAFDFRPLGIRQHDALASFARQILTGEASDDLVPACFIRLYETNNKKTEPQFLHGEDNPHLKAGSYILSNFVGSLSAFEESEADIKRKLQQIAKSYFQNWVSGTGTFLEFGDAVFGDYYDIQKASEWATFVRDEYTKTLLSLTREQLQEEVLKPAFNCPMIRLIVKAFESEIESHCWSVSQFPVEILEKMFREEARKSSNRQQILQLIECSHFENRDDIKILAEKAECAPHLIEPLIRIRIFYILCCLGQENAASLFQGISERLAWMPLVNDSDDNDLVCQPGQERVLALDKKYFDRLQMIGETRINQKRFHQPVAQGESVLSVDSLSRRNKEKIGTSIVDLQDLCFSIYASAPYRGYLIAQVEPQILIENMQKLSIQVLELAIVKKVAAFRAAEDKNKAENAKLWIWQTGVPFNKEPFQTFKKDKTDLREAISFVDRFYDYCKTYEALLTYEQMSKKQKDEFEKEFHKIHKIFKDVLSAVEMLYYDEPKSFEYIQKMSSVLTIDLEDFIPERSKKISKKEEALQEEELVEPDLGIDTELERDASPDQGSKNLSSRFWDVTLGRFSHANDEKFFRGKIERYDYLLHTAKKCIVDYLEQNELGEVDKLVYDSTLAKAPEWLQQLTPLLQFCQETFSFDEKQINGDFLEEFRKAYNVKFLGRLRIASDWAKDHAAAPGAEHIDGICYRLYSGMDLNLVHLKVLSDRIAAGRTISKGKKIASDSRLIWDSKYAILKDLFEAHQLIKAVPREESSSARVQWMKKAGVQSKKGLGSIGFDANMQSNPMHVLYQKRVVHRGPGGRSKLVVKDIAMGSPTIELGNGLAVVNPEFQGFLRHCKREGLVHLFINHQDYRSRSLMDLNESARCKAIHDLAEKDFKDTLHVITLNHKGPFYNQHGHEFVRRVFTNDRVMVEEETNVQAVKEALVSQLLEGASIAMKNYLPQVLISDQKLRTWVKRELERIHKEEFSSCPDFIDISKRELFVQRFHVELRKHVEPKLIALNSQFGHSIYDPFAVHFQEELIAQMFDRSPQETGNCIPDELVKKYDLRKWSVQLAKEIHQDLFGGRQQLTLEERRIFIRLFYGSLERKILLETKANSYNAGDKESIGYGAASDAEDYAYSAILKNSMNLPHVMEFFKSLVLSRAVLIRKRSMIDAGVERLIETVKFMIDHQKDVQKLHGKLFPNIDITPDDFEVEDDVLDDLHG